MNISGLTKIPKNKPRKHRKGEYTCQCSAYRFPHRFGGGKCTGFGVVVGHWETYYGHDESCSNCNLNDGMTCQVVQGIEKEDQCPIFQEFIDQEEIKLLGGYWK